MFFRYARTCRRSKYIPKSTLAEAVWKLPGVRNVPMNKRHYVKYAAYVAMMVTGFLGLMGLAGLGLWILTTTGALQYFLDWIGRIGRWGNLIMILLIILVQFPFMVGYGSMMLISGFLFGFKGGLATLVIGCQLGLIFVGACSRYFFREKSQEYINKNAYVQALVEELLLHKVKFSVLVRLTPLPVGLQNVLLSVNVPVWLYITSSFFGMLIEQIPMVYLGTTANSIAQILSGEGEMDPVQFLVIGISGFGILIVGLVLFWVSRNALKKVKQRQADMETETAEEGEEAVDLEELYDAEDADTVLDLDLGSDEEEWDELEMGMALGVASYAGTQPELEKGSYGNVAVVDSDDEEKEVFLHSVGSGEQLSEMEAHMISVSSGEHLADMDKPGMVVEQRLAVQCGDDLGGDEELAVVDSARQQHSREGVPKESLRNAMGEETADDEDGLEVSVDLEDGIGLAPPRSSALTRKSSTEVKAELKALQSTDSAENVAATAERFSVRLPDSGMLEDLEMFADDDDSEAMLDNDDSPDVHRSNKKGALQKLQHAVKKKLAAAPTRRASEASLVKELTKDEDIV